MPLKTGADAESKLPDMATSIRVDTITGCDTPWKSLDFMRNSESDRQTVLWLELDPKKLLKDESKLPKFIPYRETEVEPDVKIVILALIF